MSLSNQILDHLYFVRIFPVQITLGSRESTVIFFSDHKQMKVRKSNIPARLSILSWEDVLLRNLNDIPRIIRLSNELGVHRDLLGGLNCNCISPGTARYGDKTNSVLSQTMRKYSTATP